jgi:hypothetical protein
LACRPVPGQIGEEYARALMRTLLLLAVAAALVWLVLTAAHEAAGIDIMPHGGLFQFPEVHWDKAGNLP